MNRKPATSAAEYAERTRDENKARELHPSDLGNIELDTFQAMSSEGRRQVWAAASEGDRRGLALQIIRRQGHGPDEATIALYLEELDARFGLSAVERAVCGALERLADSHQRSFETAETKAERTYFSRWAGAFRKALYYYKRESVRPEQLASGAWLVPSATRADKVHGVSRDGRCSCEALDRGCWHSALVAGVETGYDELGQMDDEEEEAQPAPAVWSTHGDLGRRLCAARSRLLCEAA